jgi:hypothetical protein
MIEVVKKYLLLKPEMRLPIGGTRFQVRCSQVTNVVW